MLRLSAPNAPEAFVGVLKDADNRWRLVFRLTADGPDMAPAEASFSSPKEAWDAVFELYRERLVV